MSCLESVNILIRTDRRHGAIIFFNLCPPASSVNSFYLHCYAPQGTMLQTYEIDYEIVVGKHIAGVMTEWICSFVYAIHSISPIFLLYTTLLRAMHSSFPS